MQGAVVMGERGDQPCFFAQTAVDHGGAPLPMPVKLAMRFAAEVMRQTASRV